MTFTRTCICMSKLYPKALPCLICYHKCHKLFDDQVLIDTHMEADFIAKQGLSDVQSWGETYAVGVQSSSSSSPIPLKLSQVCSGSQSRSRWKHELLLLLGNQLFVRLDDDDNSKHDAEGTFIAYLLSPDGCCCTAMDISLVIFKKVSPFQTTQNLISGNSTDLQLSAIRSLWYACIQTLEESKGIFRIMLCLFTCRLSHPIFSSGDCASGCLLLVAYARQWRWDITCMDLQSTHGISKSTHVWQNLLHVHH